MKAKYIGIDVIMECWLDSETLVLREVKNGDIFSIRLWNKFDEMESVLTSDGGRLCDFDSQLFEEDFEIIEEGEM